VTKIFQKPNKSAFLELFFEITALLSISLDNDGHQLTDFDLIDRLMLADTFQQL
jgi:hypothetical protein